MKPLSVKLATQERSLSVRLPFVLALEARRIAGALPRADDPVAAIEEFCGCIVAATRSAEALDSAHDVLKSLRAALRDPQEALLSDHPIVAIARDLSLKHKAARAAAPELDHADLGELISEIDQGITRTREGAARAWSKLNVALRVGSWSIYGATLRSQDVGRCLRALRGAGILPAEIDPLLAFAAEADRGAPPGSPARNTADVLDILATMEQSARADRDDAKDTVARDVAARIRTLIHGEEEAA